MLKYYQFFMMMGCMTLLIGVSEVLLTSTDTMMDTQGNLLQMRSDGEISGEEYARLSAEADSQFRGDASENLGLVNGMVMNAESTLNKISQKLNLGVETDMGTKYFGSAVESFETSDYDTKIDSSNIGFEDDALNTSRSLQEKTKFYPFEIIEITSIEENVDCIVKIKVRYRAYGDIKEPSVKVEFSGTGVGSFVDEKVIYNKRFKPYDIIEFEVKPTKTNKPEDFEIVGFGFINAD